MQVIPDYFSGKTEYQNTFSKRIYGMEAPDKLLFEAKIAPCELSGRLDGWSVKFREELLEEALSIIHVELERAEPGRLPEITFSFRVPQKDAQVKWHPLRELFDCHHYQPYWWHGGREPFALHRNCPVYSYLNLEGINSMSFAFSDAFRPVFCSSGATEENRIETGFTLFSVPEEACGTIRFAVRIDRRRKFFGDLLREIADWYSAMPGNRPALPVPEAARLPFYSTWYQFQKAVSQAELEQEAELIKQCRIHSVIIDDGWQSEIISGGGLNMSSCGEWRVCPGKFPDLRQLVERFHAGGIRCLLWLALPFIGTGHPELLALFRGKLLPGGGDHFLLDPRCPEVRNHLIAVCVRLVKEYRLDGLKLDFLDSIPLSAAPAECGADTDSLPEGLGRLLAGIRDALTALNPEIIIEFRQSYTGPGMRCYGNVFRASDCAHDLLQNRVRTIDLRLLAGNSAVHSDMLIWSEQDTPEVAALQILNVLFSVPQISVRLGRLPAAQREMLAFWMEFCSRHRRTLQEGTLHPEHPELSYPLITAFGEREAVTAVYQSGLVVRRHCRIPHLIVNAKHTGEIPVDSETPGIVQLFDVFGRAAGEAELRPGLNRLMVPPAGLAICEENEPVSGGNYPAD